MARDAEELVPRDAPDEVKAQALRKARVPVFDPTLGRKGPSAWKGEPPHRLVVIGDSLTHGFQSGAVFNTDISYGAIVAHELGWLAKFRYPRYPGKGGLPLNIELLLRDLESRFGSSVNAWELPMALFRAREFMDGVEDYWERGAGKHAPVISAYNHALAVYGWDLRDALSRSAASCEAAIKKPKDDLLRQVVENNSQRAALRVYPHWDAARRRMTLFEAAAELGKDKASSTDCGIETLVVFLGANNALQTVTNLRVAWTKDADYADLKKTGAYTVWTPSHFKAEFDEVVKAVRVINARHVIWCTVPHVTIAPIARGVGGKLAPGSRYFPYYTRPWVDDTDFSASQDKHITGKQARAVDCAVDMYNDAIQQVVEQARSATGVSKRDWYLLDIAGLLDRLAARRYITDPNARPLGGRPTPYRPRSRPSTRCPTRAS